MLRVCIMTIIVLKVMPFHWLYILLPSAYSAICSHGGNRIYEAVH